MEDNIVILVFTSTFFIIGILIGKFLGKIKLEKEIVNLQHELLQMKQLFEVSKKNSLQQLKEYKDLVQSEKEYTERLLIELKEERDHIRNEKDNLQISLTQKKVALENTELRLSENKIEAVQLQEAFAVEFENLANKILEEKSQKFTEKNKENLQKILNPLQERIATFEQKVDKSNKESVERHATLGQYIKSLHEQNVKISTEATNLTKALKGDSKIQGSWGELVLERVLEKSGLEKGREYEVEKSFTVNKEKKQRLRPDVIIHLPDNKKMIVDSKVSLTAYEKLVNAETETDRKQYLKEHITSINRHVLQLSEKKYEDLYEIESPDFVLLFIPIEPAFAIATNYDAHLYNKAFEKNIVIVTPSTLLATLRTIDSMWNNSKQQQNALEIARQAGALYDKFEGLITDLTKIGKKMEEAKNGYDDAMNKLVDGRGNLLYAVEKIKKLGAKAKKSLPKSLIKKATN